ncbi:MAG: VWA domain-containing protein [Candidatus Omnitrophica bacterium]|nr:VWA domain-containing protein [Candidatus Omnitrophota bacterium]
MRFADIHFAFAFWAILAVALFIAWAFNARKKTLQKFAQTETLNEIASSVNFKRQLVRHALLVVVLALSVAALMRPQWGFQWEEVKRKGLDILIAIDTSKSMLATDVKPNRLKRSEFAVKDLIKKLKGDRIGLIAFAGTAYLQCPLTIDYNGFLLALNDLSVDTIPRGGTSISSAIRLGIKIYENELRENKILIIIADGEDHEGDPVRLAQEAKKQGVKIYCIGIGTTEGELIQLTDEKGRKSFLKDKQGNVVKSRLNEKVLQEVALTTGGAYVHASGAEFGLDWIYEDKLSKMEKRDIKAQMSKRYYERFQIPLAMALILLLIESFITDKKRR